MADKQEVAGEILSGLGPGLLGGIGAALMGPKKGKGGPAPTPPPSGPAAKPAGFKDGGVVEKTGVAKVHKGEVVIPAKSNWKDATKGLGGKSSPKKGKKEVKEIRTRKGASGGFIHTHHFNDASQEPEEHVSPDQNAMVQHMIQNMGDGGGGAATADPNAAAPAAQPVGPPQGTPLAPPGAM